MNRYRKFLYCIFLSGIAAFLASFAIGNILIDRLTADLYATYPPLANFPFFSITMVSCAGAILLTILFSIAGMLLFKLNPKPAIENLVPKNQSQEVPVPLTSEEAELRKENLEAKAKFEEDVAEHSFEDPEVGVKKPGHKLAETPATMFSPEHVEEKKEEKPDDHFPKKVLGNYAPGPS
jgi:hypothetical protein